MITIEKKLIEKRFPADTTMDCLTFLNDKKVDSELYNLLQTYSYPRKVGEDYITVVLKKELPKQADMCSAIKVKSRKTLMSHLNYLVEKGFILENEKKDGYILPNKEEIYMKIPLDTLKYLRDNCREHVIKIYIYLGQRYKFAQTQNRLYEFSLKEIAEHIGLKINNNGEVYDKINNALDLLYNSGLIDYVSYFDGAAQKKKLLSFSFEHNKNEK